VSSLFLTLLLILLADHISWLFFSSTQYTYHFRIMFLTLFFDTGIMIPLAVFRAREEPKKYVIISLVRLLLSIGLNICFVVFLGRGILGILEGGLITSGLIYFLLVPGILKSIKLKFSFTELNKMLSFGLPLVPTNIAAWIIMLSNRYFLQFFSTPTELGLYSLGYKFGVIVQVLIVGPFRLAWAPFAWSIFTRNNAKQVYSSTLTYFFLIAILAALILSVLSKEVLVVMATSQFRDAYKVIPVISLSYVLYGCYDILGIGISLQKKTLFWLLVVGAGAIVSLGLNFLLIPSYGMMGAAISTLISFLVLPVSSFFISRHYYPIQFEWMRITKIFIAALPVYIGSLYIINDSVIFTGIYKILSLLGFPFLLYIFKFFSPEEIQKAKELIGAGLRYLKPG
jgi:O-antigen/teichoic acid export membrane protein